LSAHHYVYDKKFSNSFVVAPSMITKLGKIDGANHLFFNLDSVFLRLVQIDATLSFVEFLMMSLKMTLTNITNKKLHQHHLPWLLLIQPQCHHIHTTILALQA